MYNREAINILLWKAEMPCLNVWGVSQASQLCDWCHMSPELCTTNGMAIHSALGLNQRRKGNAQSKTNNDLRSIWEGVDYLFIDEISMIGCSLLFNISEALIEAKGNTAPFGGINVIFAGDFAQLPPVGDTRLSAAVHTSQTKSCSKRGQEIAYGKLLWLSINKAVILSENMRQTGSENEVLNDLLERLREGRCTDSDYNLLSSRVLDNVNVP